MYYFSDDELAQLNANESEIEVAQIESFLEDFGEYLDNQEKKKRKDKSEPKITEKEFFQCYRSALMKQDARLGSLMEFLVVEPSVQWSFLQKLPISITLTT